MADNWRVLDFTDFHGELRFSKSKKVLETYDSESGEVTRHALGDVNIVFIGIYTSLAPAMMYHFAKHDVVVLFCDWRGLPICSMYPWIDAHGRVAARQRAQASLSAPRSKNAWMRIIKAKIRGQANNLKVVDTEQAKKLEDISRKVKTGDSTNAEGLAARIYWSTLFGDLTFRRTPGEQTDWRNSLLNYGYTLLRGSSMRAVLSAGLTPALGMYHRNRSNLFALADDLIEPFRPAIDHSIQQLSPDSSLDDKGMRKHLMEAVQQPFGKKGLSVAAVMTDLAQQYGRYVEGEVERLEVPVWTIS